MASGSLYKCSRFQLQVVGDVAEDVVEDEVSEELTALWRSNVSPTSETGPRAGYTATSYALKVIESQIRELSASLQSLEETRDRIAEKKRIYHSTLHPIRRLPPEILAEIFRTCSFGDTDLEYGNFPGSLDTRKAPWTLGQVCRAWRSVVVSASALWTQINVSWEETISASCAVSLEALPNIQLERSQEQNLSLSYLSGMTRETEKVRLQQKFLSMLCSRASQWRTAQLKSDMYGLDRLRDFRGAFHSISAFCAFEDFPSMTELSLRGDAQLLLQDEIQLPWAQITSFEARLDNRWIGDLENHSRTLQKLERAEVCILDSSCFNPDTLRPLLSSSLQLSFLHTLIIGFADDFSMDILLGWLVLPALRVLRILAKFSYTDTLKFLDRSQCFLEELAFPWIGEKGGNECRGSLIRFLEASVLHNLRTFQIRRRPWHQPSEPLWGTIIETLTLGREGKAQAMPRLRRLVLDAGRESDVIPHSTLLTMLSSRCSITSTTQASDSCGGYRLEELTFWNARMSVSHDKAGKDFEKGSPSFDQTVMDCLMEFSSSSRLACKFYWGRLDWSQVD
ncbi:hypothetical protein PQX77_011242 [Marasmius sp. AFHP31]|nr:hypothetical protein PQX77_011242 [Marasmius sp. AFHP31]